MKSVFKRFLLLGISLSVAVLVATQVSEQPERASGAGGEGEGSTQEEPVAPGPVLVPAPLPFKPLAGTRVTFSGTVVRAGSSFALRETAGVLYLLDSAGRAWPFEGNSVRVTGQLDTTTRLLHIDDIQSMIA